MARVMVFQKPQDSKASSLVAHDKVSQKQVSSANGGASSIGENPGLKQAIDPRIQAQAEVSNSGGADAAGAAGTADDAALLQQVEAQIQAVADAGANANADANANTPASSTDSLQPAQQDGAAAPH